MTRGNGRHKMKDIVMIAMCGFLCGLDSFEEVAEFAQDQEPWFRTFLELPNGIPSHDTIERVLSMLDAEQFEQCFSNWAQSVAKLFPGEVVAIDGKSMRHSYDKATSKKALHIVSAWAADNELVLGQVATDEKSNEITAIPKLLQALQLADCVVTIDAMGCQTEIARQIVEDKSADYILALKGNQPTLQVAVAAHFATALDDPQQSKRLSTTTTVDKGHGRIETRTCWVSHDLSMFADRRKWTGLRSLVMIESTRDTGTAVSTEKRYYISSIVDGTAERMLHAVRNHWGVENRLHYRLDVSMGDDASRRRAANAAHVSTVMRRIALNLFRLPGRNTTSIPRLQAKCLYRPDFRATILLTGKASPSRSLTNA